MWYAAFRLRKYNLILVLTLFNCITLSKTHLLNSVIDLAIKIIDNCPNICVHGFKNLCQACTMGWVLFCIPGTIDCPTIIEYVYEKP